MSTEHNCIICMYDDRYEIVGPFATNAAIVAYGEAWQAHNDDRPTWQSIFLANPRAEPRVVTPA